MTPEDRRASARRIVSEAAFSALRKDMREAAYAKVLAASDDRDLLAAQAKARAVEEFFDQMAREAQEPRARRRATK